MMRTPLSVAAMLAARTAAASVVPFPSEFKTQEIQTDGATLHVRIGGHGPAIVFLHGKKTQAGDVARVLDSLQMKDTQLVTHDIGNLVG
jgi:hypothetical protein